MSDSIKIFEREYYMLSNFSAHKVIFKDVEYMTSEHAYQVAKFIDPDIREKIKNAPSAYVARELGQAKEGRAESFDKVLVMKNIMREKMLQHEDVKEKLLASGNKYVDKNCPTDYFWGSGEDGSGENVMGKMWMELREELRH
ncbi:MAG: NADAR family protein [Candidatus Magasanikbacteria bacterium]|nr:NADAR family protein [Candidatus Magasanikbacteria bacterium]